VCTVTGELNIATTPLLKSALTKARSDGNPHLIIDLSGLTSMDADSAGLYTLLGVCYRHNRDRGGHLAIVVDPNSQAILELHLVALKVAFDMHHNLADALRACASADVNNQPQGRLDGQDR
jgi:anti-sigma B factor antagonist